jgi:putative NADH-flavin reductase
MQVVIFGATGSLGSYVVKEALSKGYQVRVFTRNTDKFKDKEDSMLSVFRGDVFEFAHVRNAILGANVVICCLGDGAKGMVRAAGTRNIINAMEELGVKRLICQTTLGLGESWQNLNFFWKHIMFGLFLKKAFEDHRLQESLICDSSLEYTIVRPSAFTGQPSDPNFKVGFEAHERNLNLKISREDIAGFMVNQIKSREFMRKAVSISN